MRIPSGVERVRIEFGNIATDIAGEGSIVLSQEETQCAVILTPTKNANVSAFNISADTYRVAVSVPEAVTVNHLTVNSD
jgi:hypothetical protein